MGRTSDRLHSRGAISVNGMGDPIVRYPGHLGDDASNIGSLGRHRGVPKDNLVDPIRPYAGAIEQSPGRAHAEILCRHGGESAKCLAERSADAFDDRNIKHVEYLMEAAAER